MLKNWGQHSYEYPAILHHGRCLGGAWGSCVSMGHYQYEYKLIHNLELDNQGSPPPPGPAHVCILAVVVVLLVQ